MAIGDDDTLLKPPAPGILPTGLDLMRQLRDTALYAPQELPPTPTADVPPEPTTEQKLRAYFDEVGSQAREALLRGDSHQHYQDIGLTKPLPPELPELFRYFSPRHKSFVVEYTPFEASDDIFRATLGRLNAEKKRGELMFGVQMEYETDFLGGREREPFIAPPPAETREGLELLVEAPDASWVEEPSFRPAPRYATPSAHRANTPHAAEYPGAVTGGNTFSEHFEIQDASLAENLSPPPVFFREDEERSREIGGA